VSAYIGSVPSGGTISYAELGYSFSPNRLAILGNSQQVVESGRVPAEPLPGRVMGMRLGGGEGLGIAQDRCRWWIEGMLRLLKAIEDARDPTPNELKRWSA
jgi:hypothetical protein